MPTKVFAFYNIKEGVDIEEFKAWSRRVDQPMTRSLKACKRFDVFAVAGTMPDKPFSMIVEDIDVESWEAWQEGLKSAGFAKVIEEWHRYGDASSLISVRCEKI
jgi:hypothetical protein